MLEDHQLLCQLMEMKFPTNATPSLIDSHSEIAGLRDEGLELRILDDIFWVTESLAQLLKKRGCFRVKFIPLFGRELE